MGGIRKSRKKYQNPRKRWDRARIEKEKGYTKIYGVKAKKEIRIIETFIRNKRANAKNLLALPLETRLQREKELILSLAKYGLLPTTATLDDVLSLNVVEALDKRLQTLVWKQNLAKTVLQARQFIVHGHIAIDGEKITSPNFLVPIAKVNKIGYFKGKPLQLEPPKAQTKADLKKEFEAAGGEKVFTEEMAETPEGTPEPAMEEEAE